MTVYERVQALGEWELTFRDGTPAEIVNKITPFSHIIVLPARIGPVSTDAVAAALALYTGVVLKIPRRGRTIGGHGLAWWMGDADNKGAILETAATGTAASLSTWVTAVVPSSLTVGTVTSPGGSMTTSYQWITRRQALDAICSAFGVEWRVNPTFAVDVATATNLYGATPAAITLPDGAGSDSTFTGLTGVLDVEQDYLDYASKVYVQGPGGRGSSGGASSYRDGLGNLATFVRVVDSPDCPPGTESTVAGNLLNLWSSSNGQHEITLNAERYGITDAVPAGSRLYIYDPEYGLLDTSNQVIYQGRTVFPISVRVMGVRWPVERGMTVLLRYYSGGAFVYFDLTDYLEPESPGAQLEVST